MCFSPISETFLKQWEVEEVMDADSMVEVVVRPKVDDDRIRRV